MKNDGTTQNEVIKFILSSENGRHTPTECSVLVSVEVCVRVFRNQKRCQNYKRLKEIIF